MFEEGHIYFFKDFQFNNGGDSKDKYFIVLKNTPPDLILGCLPTRNNKVPSFVDKEHGCINLPERQYNCYLFKRDQIVCDNGFYFDMTTFIYGEGVEKYSLDALRYNFPEAGVHYVEMGKLTNAEFSKVVDCFRNSSSIKRGIKKLL